MNDFERAAARLHSHARRLVRNGFDAADIADAFILQGLALWGSTNGAPEAAEALTRIWAQIRDSAHG